MKFCSSKTFRHLQQVAVKRQEILRHRHPRSILEQILEGCNQVNKRDVRGNNGLGPDLADIFELLCVFATKLDFEIHEPLIFKYPGVCSYCVRPVCECTDLLIRPEKASDSILRPFREKAMRWPIATFVRRDWKLYPCDGMPKTLGKKWRHFLSEGNELAAAFLKSFGTRSKEVVVETADLCEKVINLFDVLKIDLVSLWNSRYDLRKPI